MLLLSPLLQRDLAQSARPRRRPCMPRLLQPAQGVNGWSDASRRSGLASGCALLTTTQATRIEGKDSSADQGRTGDGCSDNQAPSRGAWRVLYPGSRATNGHQSRNDPTRHERTYSQCASHSSRVHGIRHLSRLAALRTRLAHSREVVSARAAAGASPVRRPCRHCGTRASPGASRGRAASPRTIVSPPLKRPARRRAGGRSRRCGRSRHRPPPPDQRQRRDRRRAPRGMQSGESDEPGQERDGGVGLTVDLAGV
jgi:hypothetical protein